MFIRISSKNRTQYTYTCKICGRESRAVFPGVFAPLAEYWAFAKLFTHSIIHHRKAWCLKAWANAIVKLLCGVLCGILVLIHAATYVFYPLYMFLQWLYE